MAMQRLPKRLPAARKQRVSYACL